MMIGRSGILRADVVRRFRASKSTNQAGRLRPPERKSPMKHFTLTLVALFTLTVAFLAAPASADELKDGVPSISGGPPSAAFEVTGKAVAQSADWDLGTVFGDEFSGHGARNVRIRVGGLKYDAMCVVIELDQCNYGNKGTWRLQPLRDAGIDGTSAYHLTVVGFTPARVADNK